MPCVTSVSKSKFSPQPDDPTPAQIAEACRRIRAAWSPVELARRSAWAITAPVTVTVVDNDWSTELADDYQ